MWPISVGPGCAWGGNRRGRAKKGLGALGVMSRLTCQEGEGTLPNLRSLMNYSSFVTIHRTRRSRVPETADV